MVEETTIHHYPSRGPGLEKISKVLSVGSRVKLVISTVITSNHNNSTDRNIIRNNRSKNISGAAVTGVGISRRTSKAASTINQILG